MSGGYLSQVRKEVWGGMGGRGEPRDSTGNNTNAHPKTIGLGSKTQNISTKNGRSSRKPAEESGKKFREKSTRDEANAERRAG